MSESAMRGAVVKALRPFDAMAVENPAKPGTPDVECTLGWLELKVLPHWPRTTGPILLPKFRTGQRLWLRSRWAKGGPCWLLLRVRSDWLLFDGDVAARLVGHVPREALFEIAAASWSSKSEALKELAGCLSSKPHP